jgi:hypothetical protein
MAFQVLIDEILVLALIDQLILNSKNPVIPESLFQLKKANWIIKNIIR